MRPTRARVAVVGGGPAGSATALGLARRGVPDVVLLDATRPGRPTVGESIPPAATPLLRELGVLEAVEAGPHLPCPGSRSVWGAPEPGYNDFLFDPVGRGWHLDRPAFDARLRRAAADAGVHVWAGVQLRAVERSRGGFALESASPDASARHLRADIVVDATGSRAAVARRLGARRRVADVLASAWALVDVPGGTPACDLTLLEATPRGWWYAARIPGGRAVVAFTGRPSDVRERGLGRVPAWSAALDETASIREDLPSPVSGRVRFLGVAAAPVAALDRAAGPGWVAVGDAAAAWDPLASAGITKALRDGLAAAALLAEAGGPPPPRAWAAYASRVASDFQGHLALRRRLYAAEGRWAGEPFWRGRVEGG